MDEVEPRPAKRVPTRPSGAATVPAAPADPRDEDPTGGTPRPKNARRNGSSGGTNGSKAKNGSARSNRPATGDPRAKTAQRRAAATVTEVEVPGTPPADEAAEPAVVDPTPAQVTVEVTDLVPVAPATEEGPVVIPAIVPAEPLEAGDPDGTGGLPSLRRLRRPPRALRAPVVVPRRRRPRVRRVTRVVRHVDTWSIFKVALVFNLFLYAVCLTAGVLLWQVAQNTGTVDNVERFFESFGWERFDLKGGEIYHNAWIAGLFVIVGLTGLAVLAATLFNLITDLVGGIRVSVLEEEVVAREDRGLGWRPSRRSSRGQEPSTVTMPLTGDGEPPSEQPG